jgi:hypothetical protein
LIFSALQPDSCAELVFAEGGKQMRCDILNYTQPYFINNLSQPSPHQVHHQTYQQHGGKRKVKRKGISLYAEIARKVANPTKPSLPLAQIDHDADKNDCEAKQNEKFSVLCLHL